MRSRRRLQLGCAALELRRGACSCSNSRDARLQLLGARTRFVGAAQHLPLARGQRLAARVELRRRALVVGGGADELLLALGDLGDAALELGARCKTLALGLLEAVPRLFRPRLAGFELLLDGSQMALTLLERLALGLQVRQQLDRCVAGGCNALVVTLSHSPVRRMMSAAADAP